MLATVSPPSLHQTSQYSLNNTSGSFYRSFLADSVGFGAKRRQDGNNVNSKKKITWLFPDAKKTRSLVWNLFKGVIIFPAALLGIGDVYDGTLAEHLGNLGMDASLKDNLNAVGYFLKQAASFGIPAHGWYRLMKGMVQLSKQNYQLTKAGKLVEKHKATLKILEQMDKVLKEEKMSPKKRQEFFDWLGSALSEQFPINYTEPPKEASLDLNEQPVKRSNDESPE